MNRLLVVSLLAVVNALPLHAEEYWVAWEGSDYPENEGWIREGTGDRATRSLDEGVMRLDSLANENGQDFYSIYGASDPGPGEEFVVQWRLRVNEIVWDNPIFPYDPGWSLNSADGMQTSFVIGIDEFYDRLEQTRVSFEPGVFHEWEFRSANMRSFSITLDGQPVLSGEFFGGLPYSHISWGDFVWGPTSNTEWDYFRFGVVPEPSSLVLMLASVCGARIGRRRNPQAIRATIFPTA